MTEYLSIAKDNMERSNVLLGKYTEGCNCLTDVGKALCVSAKSFTKYFLRKNGATGIDIMSLTELLQVSDRIPGKDVLNKYASKLDRWTLALEAGFYMITSLSEVLEVQTALEYVFIETGLFNDFE